MEGSHVTNPAKQQKCKIVHTCPSAALRDYKGDGEAWWTQWSVCAPVQPAWTVYLGSTTYYRTLGKILNLATKPEVS